MITFFISLVVLILGYVVYGKIAERIYGVDPSRETPACYMADGVDYIPMPKWKTFLIQFLNIAGLGPIFGAIAGAMWGPVAFLWIVFGSIFGGAIHDYLSGMLSLKHKGLSLSEIIGKYLGVGTMQVMRGFTVALLVLVGAVFIMGPAKILASITEGYLGMTFWVWVVFIYYILATLLPIDKIIGKIYPVFGFFLLFMAVGLTFAIFWKGYTLPEITSNESLRNMHSSPEKFPIFPMMFISIACGAISGFHATQSPLMARCITNEKQGRGVFYGAMITEGIVALIWAAISIAFFNGVDKLNEVMNEHGGNAAYVVNLVSHTLLGKFGAVLALLGVVAAPITSGDTAFRSARLTIADVLKFDQEPIKNRLLISIPLFVIGYILTKVDFAIIWRYFAWANQTLAVVVLWTITVYLAKEKKFYWVTLIPAIFMSMVVSSYLLFAKEGFHMPYDYAVAIGGAITACVVALFFWKKKKLSITL